MLTERALDVSRELYSEKGMQTAERLQQLGVSQHFAGRTEGVAEPLQQAVDMLLEISRGCHTFESLINLFIIASHYRTQGSPEKAIEALENVMGEAYRILDKEEHHNLRTLARPYLGRWYDDLGKLDKALSVLGPTFKQARQLWGD